MTKETNTAVAEWTPDEQIINRAGAELQLMLETSPHRPDECLRRVFLPVIERVREGVKAACPEIPSAEVADALREEAEAIRDVARTSLKPDVYPTEESWMRSRLSDIERRASLLVVRLTPVTDETVDAFLAEHADDPVDPAQVKRMLRRFEEKLKGAGE